VETGRLKGKGLTVIRTAAYCRSLAIGTSAIALCLAAPGAFAQSGPAPTLDKDTVVIVGLTIEETLPEELAKFGSQVEVTTSEQIRDGGFVDVSQTLQMTTPGLFLAPRNGPFSYLDISLQGSRTQDMLFLVDGVRVNNRLYATTITDTLPASMVERIEVLKGGQSLYYGTQAAAGVINVVTRGYTDDFNGTVSVGADTNSATHVDGYVRGAAGPGNYVLYASQDKSSGFEAFDAYQPSATDRNRGYDVKNIGGKYRFDATDRLSFDARYQFTDGRLDYANPVNTAYAKNEREVQIASLAADWRATDQIQVLAKGYYHWWDSHYTTIENVSGGGTTLVDDNLFWGFNDKGINVLAKMNFGGGFEYVAGYDFQQYSGRDDVLLIREQEEQVNAVFAQVRTTEDLIKNGSFAAGVRYNDTGGSTTTVWNVSGRYDFSPQLYVQGVAGTSFLLPTAEQLYAVDPFDPLGNPNLEAEESKSINASIGGAIDTDGAFQWQVTGFARDVDNLISDAAFADVGLDPAELYPDIDPSFYANGIFFNVPGKVKVRGFELTALADLGNGWTGQASYTNTKSETDSSSAQLARIPKDYFKTAVSYESPDAGWGADASLLYTGEQRANVSGFGSQNYGDYVVVDLAAHVFLDDAQKHKLTARLENAFDEAYATRVNSALIDGTTTGQRFLYHFRGVPQTFHVTYTYAF
jgi:vitamin B12 transporter